LYFPQGFDLPRRPQRRLDLGGVVRVVVVHGHAARAALVLEPPPHPVERRETLFVAVGITSGGAHASSQATAIAQLRGDQIWAVVDASRKQEDTARWVRKVSSVVQLDAVVGIQHDATMTPETVNTLGLPVTWEYGS